jgi:hypothetical protein
MLFPAKQGRHDGGNTQPPLFQIDAACEQSPIRQPQQSRFPGILTVYANGVEHKHRLFRCNVFRQWLWLRRLSDGAHAGTRLSQDQQRARSGGR